MVTTRTTRELMAHLTDAEVASYATQLARITTSLARIENEKKSAMSAFKMRLDRATADAAELASKVETREELRKTDCEWRPDYERRTKTLYRLDTGEELETEKLTDSEMQGRLPGFESDIETEEEKALRIKAALLLIVSDARLPLDHPAFNALPGEIETEIDCMPDGMGHYTVDFNEAGDGLLVTCVDCAAVVPKPLEGCYLDAMKAHDCDDTQTYTPPEPEKPTKKAKALSAPCDGVVGSQA